MGAPVPADDLPSNAVPASDLPGPAAPQDTLTRAAPYYLGPLGLARGIRDASNAIDHAAYTAGQYVTDKASGVLPPGGAALAGTATNVGIQSIPMLLGGEALKPAGAAVEWLARRVMQSAIKPSRAAIDSGKAGDAITTLLDNGINATEGGARILRGKIDALNNEVGTILQQYPNGAVDKAKVIDAFSSAYEKALKQGTPQADLKILDTAINDFSNHPLFANTDQIPVQLAQEIKKGVWRKLGEKSFGKGLVPDASRDAQKAIGTGLRQGIEDVAPEVGPVNAQMGEFINALKRVESRTGMEGNKNIIGLGALSPSLEHALVWMLDRSPAGKSMLARFLHSGGEQIPATAGRVIGAGIGAGYAGRQPSSLEEALRK